MWANPRLLNLAAGILVGIALLRLRLRRRCCWLLRSPLLPGQRGRACTGDAGEHHAAEIEAALRARIGGNFFAVDLGRGARRAGAAALGAARRGAPRLARPAGGHARGARRARALGRRRAWSNTHGERFRGQDRRRRCRCFVAPGGHRAPRWRGATARFAELRGAARRRARARGAHAAPRLAAAPGQRPAPRCSGATPTGAEARLRALRRGPSGDARPRGTREARATSTCAIRTASRCACRSWNG